MNAAAVKALALGLALVALTGIVFGPTLGHDFVNYDDDAYIHLQPEIVRGLSASGIAWALTHFHSGNWHPLTSLSHMLDCQLWGLQPRGHHLSNVVLHAAAAWLLFLAVRALTGRIWRSAFIAALFAVHPLRVESVAWIAERKDVLSGVFFLLTLLAYAHYVRRPGGLRYASMTALFACGLMAKPMLVTLPCVLLLLDFWPLQRRDSFARLIAEKLPLLLLSLGVGLITLVAQAATIRPLAALPFSTRLANAALALVIYLREMVWPARLAVFHQWPVEVAVLPALAAAGLLLALSVLSFCLRQRAPYLALGWFWYLGMSLPVLGLVQVGLQAHADRYTYLPQIGLSLAFTWAAAEISRRWKFRLPLLAGTGVAVLAALAVAARVQASYWRDSETLWRHTLAVTRDNAVAHTNLGNVLPAAAARPHYEAALALEPDSVLPMNNLAWILATAPEPTLRDGARAVSLADKANQLSGGADPVYLRTLAVAYAEAGRFREAIATAERALPLAEAAGNEALAFDLRNNLSGFRRREPVRDTSLAP